MNNQPPPSRIHLLPRRWLALAGAVALIGFGWWASGGALSDPPSRGGRGAESPVPVVAVQATTGNMSIMLDALGSVTPANSVLVRPQVNGRLLRLHFSEGETVEAGQLLAEIDARPFEARLTQARGQLAKDEAQLKHARLDLERYRDLWRQDSIARQVLETQEALVQQHQGQMQISRGQVDDARLQLDYAQVTAPIDGRVGLRLVDPGNLVQAADPIGLVRITQLQPMHVLFTLPEDALPRLLARLGSGERLSVDAYDRALRNRLAEGVLLSLDNQIDVNSGTVRLKAEFANTDGALFPNQFVNIRLHLETLSGATLLPNEAIQRGAKGSFVYALDEENRVRRQAVSLGATDASRVAVLSGLQAGEQVVLDGIDRLRDGTLVKPQAERAEALPHTAQLPRP